MKVLVLENDAKKHYENLVNEINALGEHQALVWQKFYHADIEEKYEEIVETNGELIATEKTRVIKSLNQNNPIGCTPCPMTDPDIVICVGSVAYVTYEDLAIMGITSKPVRVHANLGNKKIGVMYRSNDDRVLDNNNFIISYNPDHWNVDDPIKRKFLKQKMKALPLPFKISSIPEKLIKYDTNKIAHTLSGGAVSGAYSKQTIVIQNAIKGTKLKLDRIQGVSWSDAVDRKAACSVCYDNFAGMYGVTSIEAMQLGIPTICYLDPEIREYYGELFGVDLPIITPESKEWNARYDELEAIIKNIDSGKVDLQDIGMKSKLFMSDYSQKVTKMYIDYFKEIAGSSVKKK